MTEVRGAAEELREGQVKIDKMLKKLEEETGYPIVQQHGQRIFGPPREWTGPVPERGSELYCFRIPRDCHEDELIPVFRSAGTLYQVRTMIEFSGANRGFCYVRYSSPAEAEEAKRKLDGYQIRPGAWINVTRSVDNKKIMIRTSPPVNHGVSDQEILVELEKILDGVSGVRRLKREWLKIEFVTHQKAAIARKHVVPNAFKILGYASIKEVDWADPEMEGVTIPKKKLFLRSSSLSFIPEETIRSFFNSLCGDRVRDVVIGPRYGFITFVNHEAAKEVMECKDRILLGRERVRVDWWNPGEKKGSDSPFELTEVSSSIDEVFRLSEVKGWGYPQYRLETSLDINLEPRYQYSVVFTEVPFEIIGPQAEVKEVALTNCVNVALQEVSRDNLFVSSNLPPIQYTPEDSIPLIPTSPE